MNSKIWNQALKDSENVQNTKLGKYVMKVDVNTNEGGFYEGTKQIASFTVGGSGIMNVKSSPSDKKLLDIISTLLWDHGKRT